jgi:hypothetical protein
MGNVKITDHATMTMTMLRHSSVLFGIRSQKFIIVARGHCFTRVQVVDSNGVE